MTNSKIFEGKTSTEAIEKGLKEFNCRKDDVDIKILENEEKRSFYSILAPRIVKVEMTIKDGREQKKYTDNHEEHEIKVSKEDIEKSKENIENFLNKFLKSFNGLEYKIEENNSGINVEISGEDEGKLIGYRGEVINALQTLLSVIGNKEIKSRVKISVDICKYKEKREATLKELAKKLEKTVTKTRKKLVLEPMSAYERKIIHTELQDSSEVTTYSIGEEPHRKVVIDIKNK